MLAYTTPMIISAPGSSERTFQALERVALTTGAGGGGYDESWLQSLIQQHPLLLPIADIEPALYPPISVCIELPVASGYADNLLMTADGGIVIVEAKLWRNAESRRKVIAQVLDYAKDLSRLNYESLEQQVHRARRDVDRISLYNLVCPNGAPEDEARFADAVSRNLRLGRMLLLIAGDGIQESLEQLAEFLQRHVGLHFSLALVEISLWRDPSDGRVLVQPKIVARTVQIERAVIRMEAGLTSIPVQIEAISASASRPSSLSEDTFYEQLGIRDPLLPVRLRSFLAKLEPLGVVADLKKHLSLKWRHPERGNTFNMGVILPDGGIDTSYCQAPAGSIGRYDLSEAYQRSLAGLGPGLRLKETPRRNGWRVVQQDDRAPRVLELLNHEAEWIGAIEAYIEALAKT